MLGLFQGWRKSASAHEQGRPDALRGSFEVTPSGIWGWVLKAPYYPNGTIRVIVRRGCNTLATLDVADKKQNYRERFDIPFEGRFTPEELIREKVVITARNSRGDTGRLLLQGANQLELIRKYIGVPAETVLSLDFGRGGNARKHFGEGWWNSEQGHTYMRGDESFLYFPTPSLPGNYRLRFKAAAFVANNLVKRLEIFLNNHVIETFIADDCILRFYEFKVISDAFSGASTSVLRFYHPYPIRPIDYQDNNPDRRAVSFRLTSLEIVRLIDQES